MISEVRTLCSDEVRVCCVVLCLFVVWGKKRKEKEMNGEGTAGLGVVYPSVFLLLLCCPLTLLQFFICTGLITYFINYKRKNVIKPVHIKN